jgi:hypothetical protein
MDIIYVFVCGVVWSKYGEQGAGQELLRTVDSGDGEMKALAGAMFEKGLRRLQSLEKQA